MAYNASFDVTLPAGGAFTQVIAPAANVAGVIIEQVLGSAGAALVVLAKAGAPANERDGDLLALINPPPIGTRIKVPAGKGVWASGNQGVRLGGLYTVL